MGGNKDDVGRKFWLCLFVVWFCLFLVLFLKSKKMQPDTKASKEEVMDKLVRNTAFIS